MESRGKGNSEFIQRNLELGKVILAYNQGDTKYKKSHKEEYERACWDLTLLNIGLVRQHIIKIRGFLDDELLSHGIDALHEKAMDWDFKIASIGAYAGPLIRRGIINRVYKQNKRNFPLTENMISPNLYDNPLEALIELENQKEKEKKLRDVKRVINNGVLSDIQKYVIREHYFKGRQLNNIAEEKKVSKERISYVHRSAIRKIQKALKLKYDEIKVRPKYIVKSKKSSSNN